MYKSTAMPVSVDGEHLPIYDLLAKHPEPTLITDEGGCVVFANEAAVALLGINEMQQPLAALMPHGDVRGEIAEAVASDAARRIEITRGTGETLDVAFLPVAGVGVVVCMHDITHLRQLSEMKSQLVSVVSHDLKGPLTVVRGFAELLADEKGLSPDGCRCVEGILASVEKMRILIENVLDLTQIEAGICREVGRSDVGLVISGIIQDLRPQASKKNQDLTACLSPVLPDVHIDPVRLGQAVRNLVDNAIKYTPDHGHIQVRAETRQGRLFVEVQDDGPGIPQAARSQLFERFYRVGSPETSGKEGTGLGLSIVRAIIEDYDGEVGVESKEGKGSTFWFWLPLKEPA